MHLIGSSMLGLWLVLRKGGGSDAGAGQVSCMYSKVPFVLRTYLKVDDPVPLLWGVFCDSTDDNGRVRRKV